MRLSPQNLFGIIGGEKFSFHWSHYLAGNKPGATGGHLITTSLTENEANRKKSRSKRVRTNP